MDKETRASLLRERFKALGGKAVLPSKTSTPGLARAKQGLPPRAIVRPSKYVPTGGSIANRFVPVPTYGEIAKWVRVPDQRVAPVPRLKRRQATPALVQIAGKVGKKLPKVEGWDRHRFQR